MTVSKSTRVLLLLFLASLSASAVAGDRPAIWGDLQPGPYAVGFRTIEKYDYSRTFRPMTDYFGEPIPGESARPIQVCLWYPAQADSEAVAMVLSEYIFPSPDDYEFFAYVSGIQRRELTSIAGVLGIDGNQILDAISIAVSAVRDAPPAAGRFPVVIYHPDLNGGVAENAVLCEYLASHGYVIVTTHNVGGASLEVSPDIYDAETLIRDKETALGFIRELEFVDPDAIGLLGKGFGGITAAAMQSRNFDVDFVATLDDWCLRPERLEQTGAAPLLNVRRMSVPTARFYRSNDTTIDRSVIDEWRFSNRYFQPVDGIAEGGFTVYPALRTIMEAGLEATPHISRPDFDAMCERLLLFFDARVRFDVDARDELLALVNTSSELTLLLGEDLPPTQNQFLGIVRTYGAARAEEIYKRFSTADPGSLTIHEGTFNIFGYQALQRGQTEDALILFRMNAEAHPMSANCYDSWADGMQAASDTAGAITCYRKVLEVLPGDSAIDSSLARTLRDNAEQGLQRLIP